MSLSEKLYLRLTEEGNRRRQGNIETDVPFGEKLKALRERLNLSQDQFSKKYGIPVGNIRNWEQGARVNRPESAAVLLVKLIDTDPEGVARLVQSANPSTDDFVTDGHGLVAL